MSMASLRAGSWLEPGQLCWLRIASLNEELSDALEKKIIRYIPKQLTLYKMSFRMDDVFSTHSQHEWAGESIFSEIAQEWRWLLRELMFAWNLSAPRHFEAMDWIAAYLHPSKYLEVFEKSGMHSPLNSGKSMSFGLSLQMSVFLLMN